jgi:drug/metabolite transporter (DMT)-like permease
VTAASPSTLAVVLVLASALLHAVVNALVKISDDALLTRGCMNAVALAVALPLLPFVLPPGREMWAVLGVAVAVHGLYPFFVVAAYRHGDLSVAFPVARGVVPLGVAGLSLLFTDLGPPLRALPFLLLASLGVAAFALENVLMRGASSWKSIGFAIVTGVIVAAYTLIDSVGLRQAPSGASYIVWLLVLDGLFVLALVAVARRGRVMPFATLHWRKTVIAGLLGVASYALALAALALGNPAEIAMLRETSLVFAALIGWLFMRERFGTWRALATILVLAGAAGMKLGA